MALDKTYILDKREYTIDTVPADVLPEEEREYAAMVRKLLQSTAIYALDYFSFHWPSSELVEKLVASGGVGGVTYYLLEPQYPNDIVLTDLILTRSFDKLTFTYTRA